MLENNRDSATLYNLINGQFAIVKGKENVGLLYQAERNEPIAKCELMDSLSENGMGDYYESPVYIDKLRKFNVFSQKRMYKQKPYLHTVVIQITGRCSKNCPDCSEIFCPMCTTVMNQEKSEVDANSWTNKMSRLVDYGARQFVLTGGDIFNYAGLNDVIDFLKNAGASVAVNVANPRKVNKLIEGVHYNILINDRFDAASCMRFANHANNGQVSFLTFNSAVYRAVNGELPINLISSAQQVLSAEYLLPADLDYYFDKKYTDVCLNGKMVLLPNGDIVPCLGHTSEHLGNIFDEPLPDLIRRLDQDYWKKGVDDRDVYGSCSECTMRYSCPRCRYTERADRCAVLEELS